MHHLKWPKIQDFHWDTYIQMGSRQKNLRNHAKTDMISSCRNSKEQGVLQKCRCSTALYVRFFDQTGKSIILLDPKIQNQNLRLLVYHRITRQAAYTQRNI